MPTGSNLLSNQLNGSDVRKAAYNRGHKIMKYLKKLLYVRFATSKVVLNM